MSYIPPVPPPPEPPKKSRWWVWLLVGILVALVLGAIGRMDEGYSDMSVPSNTLSNETSLEVVRLAWNMELTASDRAGICDYYNTPPVGTTPEMVRIFADGAEISYAEADRLLDQLLAEEC